MIFPMIEYLKMLRFYSYVGFWIGILVVQQIHSLIGRWQNKEVRSDITEKNTGWGQWTIQI